jgi:hypothetical protein
MVRLEPFGWERMVQAVEMVRDRLHRAAAALESASIPYAVIGGNAVGEWVGRVDRAAVRNTQDVDMLIRRSDLTAAIAAMESAGFVYRHSSDIDMFLDGPGAKARDAVHIIFSQEKVRKEYDEPAPDVMDSEPANGFQVISLPAIVKMKLTSFRDKDRTHLRDLIDVGLVDQSWTARLPEKLATRLQQLLDTPDG